MNVKRIYQSAVMDDQGTGGASAPAAAPSAPAPAASAPAASGEGANGAPAPAAPQPGSLLARGAADGSAGHGAAAAPAAPGAGSDEPRVPDKFIVKNEDGTPNWEATALKVAGEGYAPLEKRLHAGDAPPKSPDDYAPELPQGLTLDTLKTDPLYAGFLKGAHAKGMTNAQVSYAVEQFSQRLAMMEAQRNSPEVAEAELRKVWTNEQDMTKGLANAYRAAKAFGGDEAAFQRLEAKFGNDPDYLQLMARIGGELGEDRPPQGLTSVEAESLEALRNNPAYMDQKHPEHKVVVARVTALYDKMFSA